MGNLISLTEWSAGRDSKRNRSGAPSSTTYFFALDCPVSYLLADRVERDFGEIPWVPALSVVDPRRSRERIFQAKSVADAMRLPLIEPENFPGEVRPVSRAAVFAAGLGRASGFAVAAMRLAFAGGYDLSDPDVIAEAAAAALLPIEQTVQASQDPVHDAALDAATRGLQQCGIAEPPAVRVDGGWFSGYDALAQASAFQARQS